MLCCSCLFAVGFVVWHLFYLFFEIGSLCSPDWPQKAFKLAILLPECAEDYKYVPPCLASNKYFTTYFMQVL
jgi:hypothetical protein